MSLEETYLFSLPIEEPETFEFFLGGVPQGQGFEDYAYAKWTLAGPSTSIKTLVTIGDYNGHAYLGVSAPKR